MLVGQQREGHRLAAEGSRALIPLVRRAKSKSLYLPIDCLSEMKETALHLNLRDDVANCLPPCRLKIGNDLITLAIQQYVQWFLLYRLIIHTMATGHHYEH